MFGFRRPIGPPREQIDPDSFTFVTDEEWVAFVRANMNELRPLMHLDWRA